MFADDCIIFGEASYNGVEVLKSILKEYEVSFGQCVNYEKSTVFFSANTVEETKDFVTRELSVRCLNNSKKYLGLPNMIGKRKKASFLGLKDRTKKRIDNWSTRSLSLGGKEVFIKAVLQAIPTYVMSCFLLPKVLCDEMESVMTLS